MAKGYIMSNQSSLFGQGDVIGFGDDNFFVREISRNEANDIIVRNHYSGKFYNATYIHLGVFMFDKMVGVLQFGYAMNPASAGSVVEGTEKDEYLELNRMWLDDVAPKNSESRALSCAFKFIKRKYPKVKWVQSFADERCGGFGIVYQACSFDYFGEHTSVFWELDGEVFHNSVKTSEVAGPRGYKILNSEYGLANSVKHELRQFRYIKFLDQREKKNCKLKQKPYPKHYKGD